MSRLLSVTGAALLAVALAMPVEAGVGATFVLRSGERVSGTLIDMGAGGFQVNLGGQPRRWSIGEVAVVDFTGTSTFPGNEINQAGAGPHVMVLRSGQIITGRLVDIGGSSPLRITFAGGSGNQDFSSNDVARIYFDRPGANTSVPGTTTQGLATAAGRYRVPANAGWVNTGLTVYQGQTLLFNTTGEVRLSTAADDVANAAGSTKGRYATNAPLPSSLAGALIGRIGNSAPFGIGNQTSIPSPASGTLWLAVNDDVFNDNAGEFGVDITPQARPRR